MTPEEQAAKEYAEAGVDLPELKEEKKEEPVKEPTKESPKEEPKDDKEPEKEPKKPEDSPEHLQDEPKEPRKRSIYDEYKEKKSELKTERDAREKAERERDKLAEKLSALNDAGTSREKQEAQDEIDSFITSHKEWDKSAIQDLVQLARKGIAPMQLDESLKKDLDEFKSWKTQNSTLVEKQRFEEEFKTALPTFKEYFPTASSEEVEVVKTKLDELSHTKKYHDKDLDYVLFKEKETLSTLISPKKRGIEGKGKKDIMEESFDFDPDADYSKMTPKQREAWEAEYAKLGKTEGLATDSQGRKILI